MPKHLVSPILPPLVDDERFNRNGMIPNAVLMRRVAEGMNFISHRCKKQVFLRCQALNNVDGGGSAAELLWPVYFRTGEATTGLRVAAGLCLSDFDWKGAALSPPEFKITVKDSGGSTVTTKGWQFGGTTGTATVAPDDLHHINDTITGLSANTEYYLVIETLSGARAVFLAVVESQSRYADDTVANVCDPSQLVAEGPIYDIHLQDLIGADWVRTYEGDLTPAILGEAIDWARRPRHGGPDLSPLDWGEIARQTLGFYGALRRGTGGDVGAGASKV